jgi:adenylate kinase
MFLGAPGVGKGTYAGKIAPKYGIPTISTGDLIRAEVKKPNSTIGKELASYTSKGLLVPDATVVKMVQQRLQEKDCEKGYLLDGFPRNLTQAEILHKIEPLRLVVNITLKQEYLERKILGRRVCPCCNKNFNVAHISDGEYQMPPLLPKHGNPEKCDCDRQCTLEKRADDTPETVRQRLIVYEKETAPLIGYYSKLGSLLNFDVKKGLDDLPKLEVAIKKFLGGK